MDLHGQNAIVAGGLFVNNGFVGDSTGSGATIIADFGSLVKGAGTFANPVITQNGGKFQAGNCPGIGHFGHLVLGPGRHAGLQLADQQRHRGGRPARRMPTDQVSGWSLISAGEDRRPVTGQTEHRGPDLDGHQLAGTAVQHVVADADQPDTVGPGQPGRRWPTSTHSMQYVWKFVSWQGNYTGPTDDATLTATVLFDADELRQPAPGGTFSLHYDGPGKEIDLVYTPVPEPGTLALTAAAAGVAWSVRRRRPR